MGGRHGLRVGTEPQHVIRDASLVTDEVETELLRATPTLRWEHAVGEMVYLIHLAIVGVDESFNMAPRTVNRLRMTLITLMDEHDLMFYSVVRVAINHAW
jgi:hypothetical protein